MSSDYEAFCLSHDPALGMERGRSTAEDAVEYGRLSHPKCDLLIGRYSGALVEVGCPSSPMGENDVRHPGYHPHHIVWVEAGWLRLALAALDGQDGAAEVSALDRAVAEVTRLCWRPQRIARLRPFLDL